MLLTFERLLGLVGGSRYGEKNIKLKCPRCQQDECYISVVEDDHPGQCLRKKHCGWTFNIYTFLKEIGRISEILSNTYSYSEIIKNPFETEQIEIVLEHEDIRLPFGYKKYSECNYLFERGWESKHFDLYQAGYTKLLHSFKDRIIFPVFEDGKTKAYTTRSIFKKEYCLQHNIIRYSKNEESEYTRLLYNIDNVQGKNTAILTEGIFDCKQVNDFLDNDTDIVGVSLLGVNLSIEQVLKLKMKGIKNLIFFLDPDVLIKVRSESQKYKHLFDNIFVTYTDNKDPGDSSFDELEKSLSNMQTVSNFLIDNIPFTLK